jgi:Spy/CpxP family protein refolding chaperone
MMKNAVTALGLSIALALGSAACSGQAENTAPQTSASALSKAPIGASTHGVVKMIGEALGEVPLRPDQRVELEKLAQEAEQRHVAAQAGHKELMLAVADQVEKGAIDRAALQPKIDRVVTDAEKARPEDQAALARVHALLDPSQRNAFVDALEARFAGMRGKFGKHGRHGAGGHGEHAKGGEHAQRGMRGGHEGFAGMKQLAEELKLTDEQRSQIRDVMRAGMEEHRGDAAERGKGKAGWAERAKAFRRGKEQLDAFRTETFDPKAGAPADLHAKIEQGTTRAVSFAEKVLPILTPEQRKIAADKIRAMANKGEMGPLGH